MTNTITLDSLYSQTNQSELYHHGILGMHWGVRRFQPYGQGYDPLHEGKEVGLAARMGGGHGSFSSTYGRGRSKSEMAKAALRNFGGRAKKGLKEGLERAEYAADRFDRGVQNAAKKARSGLAKYAAGYDTDLDARRAYESASASDLARGILSTFGSRAKTKVSDFKRTSWDDVKSAMGDGASRFQESMAKTKIASKQFSTNAQATMALLRGVMDPRSSASQILEGRSVNKKATPVKSFGNNTTRDAWSDPSYKLRFNKDFEDTTGERYTPERLSKYLMKRGQQPTTTKRYLEDIRSPLNGSRSDMIRRADRQTGASLSLRSGKDLLTEAIDQKSKSQPLNKYSMLEALARTAPIESGSRSLHIYDRGENRGIDRDDPEWTDGEFVDFYRNPHLPELSSNTAHMARQMKRMGVTLEPISQISSSSSTDIGKRLLGL